MIARIRPRRNRGWADRVFDRAQVLYNARPTPTPTELTAQLSAEQADLGPTPGESAIRDWIKKSWITLDPEDAPWSLDDPTVTAEDAALVLPVIRWAADTGRPRPSRKIGEWIVRVRRIAGRDLDLQSAYELAQHARRGGGDVERVEEYLSYEPWTEAGAEALSAAHDAGRLSFGITFMAGGVEPRKGPRR